MPECVMLIASPKITALNFLDFCWPQNLRFTQPPCFDQLH